MVTAAADEAAMATAATVGRRKLRSRCDSGVASGRPSSWLVLCIVLQGVCSHREAPQVAEVAWWAAAAAVVRAVVEAAMAATGAAAGS